MSSLSLCRLASVAIFIAIWILSFLPGSLMPSVPGSDKWHHALAYFMLMFTWGFWFTRPLSRMKLAIAFIAMGALIECLQGLTAYRSFEWLDIIADTVGVGLAWLLVTVQMSVQRAVQRRLATGDEPPRSR